MTAARRRSAGDRSRAVQVTVSDGRGHDAAAPGLARWLERVAPARARGAVHLALVSDARMRLLNRNYRGIDRVTDVLSFPAVGGGGGVEPNPLGEIAIARGQAARQARVEGHPLAVELRILALHGLLHLLGYDHETDQGQMRRLEDRLRRRAGLPHGLVTRASGGRAAR